MSANRGYTLTTILRMCLRDLLEQEAIQRLRSACERPGPTAAAIGPSPEEIEAAYACLKAARDAKVRDDQESVAEPATKLMHAYAIREQDRERVARGILNAHISYRQKMLDRMGRDARHHAAENKNGADASPPKPQPISASEPCAHQAGGPTVSALIEPFFKVRKERDSATNQVMAQARHLRPGGDQPPA